MHQFLNVLLTAAHIVLILFVLLGWIPAKLRKTHFIVMIAIALSWFVLGIWFGWGYCVLTDWHWNIKEKLGERDLPDSFIKYSVDYLTSGDVNSALVDTVTLIAFIAAALLTVGVNFVWKSRKSNGELQNRE